MSWKKLSLNGRAKIRLRICDMEFQQPSNGAVHDANSSASKIVKPLIPPDAQDRIERAVKQANASLREQIRVETGLRLSDGAERFAIPFRVCEGFTSPFGDLIMRYPDQQLWWLICGLRQIGGIVEGAEWLLEHWPDLEKWDRLPPGARGGGDAIARARDVALELQKFVANPPLIGEIKKITTDYLGCYFYPPGRPPWIEIYWMPIALIAAMLNIRMEDLAVVTSPTNSATATPTSVATSMVRVGKPAASPKAMPT